MGQNMRKSHENQNINMINNRDKLWCIITTSSTVSASSLKTNWAIKKLQDVVSSSH
jgi:hypothetical protein